MEKIPCEEVDADFILLFLKKIIDEKNNDGANYKDLSLNLKPSILTLQYGFKIKSLLTHTFSKEMKLGKPLFLKIF